MCNLNNRRLHCPRKYMQDQLKVILLLVCYLTISLNNSFSAGAANLYPAFGQHNGQKIPESLHKIISVNLNMVSFEEALKIISERADLKLNYNLDRLPLNKKVSINMTNAAAVTILLKVLTDTGAGLKITKDGLIAVVPSRKSKGEIRGTIIEKKSGKPLAGVNAAIEEKSMGAATDSNGQFVISKLPMGIYTIEFSMVGYKPERISGIIITENTSVELHIELSDTLLSLNEIIVTPGQFSLMKDGPGSINALSSADIQDFPQLGEDIYRAVQRLPGLSGIGDFSAKFSVRGGEQDEVLVLLDGIELYDPFHLKDFNGSMSIIDYGIIKSVDMFTGAFSSEYGNALSGVFNMKTSTPVLEKPRTSLSLSLLNTRIFSEGNFNGGKGAWQAIGRLGYIRYVLKTLGFADDFDPSYYDFFGKVQYSLNDKNFISAHFLRSYDNIFARDTEFEVLDASYGNTYGWLKWDAQFSSSLSAQTVLSTGRVSKDRSVEVSDIDDIPEFKSSEQRGLNFYGLKQDYSLSISSSYLLKWGFDARQSSVEYNFYRTKTGEELPKDDLTELLLKKDGTELGLYFTHRFRLLDPLTAEAGLRWDYASWANDKNYSPRVNISYELGEKTVIRAGWGMFYQSQKIHQLHIIDDEKTFRPASKSMHNVIGLEHEFDSGIYLRLEAYHKRLSHIHPRFLNFVNIMDISPEISGDRIKIEPERGEAKGIELYTYGKINPKHSFWTNFTYSVVEEIVGGLTVPRNMDQRFTINFDYNYRPNDAWALNIAWQYHSGWPYTEAVLKYDWLPDGSFIVTPFEPGLLNGNRFPAYHRLDVRLRRYFNTSKGRISLFLEVYNLYNKKNIREYDYEFSNITREGYDVKKTSNGWLPIMPTFGISWDF